MARYTGPKCRNCRRFGMKLCTKPPTKCAWERRKSPPRGQQSTRRRRVTEYGTRLREKQKARAIYGILERQFSKYFKMARDANGATGDILFQLLETRMDNVVYRLSFADSRSQARQIVNHGHMLLNGKRMDIPSHHVQVGDIITWKRAANTGDDQPDFISSMTADAPRRPVPSWLRMDLSALSGEVVTMPDVSEIESEIDSRLIVEFYSR